MDNTLLKELKEKEARELLLYNEYKKLEELNKEYVYLLFIF
jgi:hypothetical protein